MGSYLCNTFVINSDSGVTGLIGQQFVTNKHPQWPGLHWTSTTLRSVSEQCLYQIGMWCLSLMRESKRESCRQDIRSDFSHVEL